MALHAGAALDTCVEPRDAEEVRLAANFLDQLPGDVERRMGDEVNDGIALIARSQEREFGRIVAISSAR